ncbi:MAG: ABC transporter ATP-binding protein [Hungatella hathewayi]|nr:ABC transporter ATP-binding protein [Hungatella hathewayi]
MAYIEFRNITKMFGDNRVLDEITMEVQKGDLVTLLGPSGCGKSTLLRCLSGLESVTEGQIFLDGEDITETPPSQRNVGMVFQQYSLFPNMTVEQNIAFGLKMKKAAPEVIDEKVRGAIRMVELEGKEKSYPANLSGGQQQRVALARSIVMEPKVLLLDEPLSAIDAKLRKSLQSSIRQIHKELGLTTIFVTHDQDEAMVMSDVIQLFHAGKIEQSGSPIAMYTEPKTKFAAGFIGNYNILTASEFIRVTGKPYEASEDVAIRPETISVSRTVKDVANAYHFEGIIKNNTPRGNVLRYDIDVNGVMLKADVLFRSFQLYENGSRVQLAVENHNCLALK